MRRAAAEAERRKVEEQKLWINVRRAAAEAERIQVEIQTQASREKRAVAAAKEAAAGRKVDLEQMAVN